MKLWTITIMAAFGETRKVTRYAETAEKAISGVAIAENEIITDVVPWEV
jgi:hypothetical protein